MDPTFVKYNFSKGALGCLLSHIKCIKLAKAAGYKKIIVFEDDFILKERFLLELESLMFRLEREYSKWDFVYLGKKQGCDSMRIDINKSVHRTRIF